MVRSNTRTPIHWGALPQTPGGGKGGKKEGYERGRKGIEGKGGGTEGMG